MEHLVKEKEEKLELLVESHLNHQKSEKQILQNKTE